MHTHRTALAAPLLLPCILMAAPAIEWRAELSSTEAATLYARHGDAVSLSCRLALRGAPYAPASAQCHYQTNGMSQAWWEAPVSVSSNVATVAWSPALDPGADLVLLMLELDGAHRAAAHLHLRPGPSGGSALPPPAAVLDFAAIQYTNAPWALPADIPPAPDLSAYATTSYVAEAVAAIPAPDPPDLSAYATTSYVAEAVAAIPAPDLSAYATTGLVASMHPAFEEWASPTVDRIAASAVAPSTTTAQRGDTYVTTGAASGYALRAVRSVRSGVGMDSETEIPGTWSIVGNTTAANLTSNVLSSTSTPGDVTVEFAPSGIVGAPTMRAVVSMPGDAVRTSTTWPAGEVASSWRYGVQMDSVVFDPGPPYRLVQTNEWNGTTYICRSALAAMPYLTATAPNPEFGDPAMAQALCVYLDRRRWRNDGGSIAGGFIGVSEHYVLYAVHSGGVPEGNYLWTTNWASGAVSAQPSGYANVATWGDLGLRRLTKGVVPPECRAKFLRESTLAELSPSRLIRAIGFAHTQHGAISPCLLEPRPSKADQTGATWDNGWVYLASRDTWRNTEWDGIRELCHDAHGGDSGHIAFFWVRQRLVPIGLFHWAGGSGECLMSDTLLDKIDAAIRRDSGNAESLTFYTAEELQ